MKSSAAQAKTPDTSALHGKCIVNTRALHQAAEFDALLMADGAIPLSYPCIAITPPEDTGALDAALLQAAHSEFDWLIVTSANTVIALKQRLDALNIALNSLSHLRVGVVGSATAAAVESDLGLKIDFMPEKFTSDALADSFALHAGTPILLPQSAIAETTLADRLCGAGANVTTVTAYETTLGTGGVNLRELLRENAVDVITLTSSSTVDNIILRLEAEGAGISILGDVCIACIGPKTAETAAKRGLQVAVVPPEHTLAGLIDSLETYFARQDVS